MESYYVMDDFSDYEYAVDIETEGPHSSLGVYFPSPNEDPTMGGLGLQVQMRLFQWANILAEDAMFIIYRITNKGEDDQMRLQFIAWCFSQKLLPEVFSAFLRHSQPS